MRTLVVAVASIACIAASAAGASAKVDRGLIAFWSDEAVADDLDGAPGRVRPAAHPPQPPEREASCSLARPTLDRVRRHASGTNADQPLRRPDSAPRRKRPADAHALEALGHGSAVVARRGPRQLHAGTEGRVDEGVDLDGAPGRKPTAAASARPAGALVAGRRAHRARRADRDEPGRPDRSRRRRLESPAAARLAGARPGRGLVTRREANFFTRFDLDSPGSSVWVVSVDGTRLRRLAAGIAGSWSPDGSRILYTKSFPGRLFMMDADGSGKHAIPVVGADPDWK